MITNSKVLKLMCKIMPQDITRGYWQLGYLLQFVMDNPESINNLHRDVYPFVAERFRCKPWCIEKNISRLIPLIDTAKLSEITGIYVDVETLTTTKLIRILVFHLRLNAYHSR